jgi:uncharacterized protein (TIGR02996 family)
MHDEDDFLRALSENPADDTLRMIYADWLDERADDESKAKAQFLRVTVRLMGPIQRVGWRHARRKELHELAQELPTEWLAVVSRLKIENCPEATRRVSRTEPPRYGRSLSILCDRRWDELAATNDPTVRRCARCEENVYYCDTIDDANKHVRRGHCVALSLALS